MSNPQNARSIFNLDEIEKLINEVIGCMSTSNVPEGTIKKCLNPKTKQILQSLKASDEAFREQQDIYGKFVYSSLNFGEGAVEDQSNSAEIFEEDLTQYEALVAHSMMLRDTDVIDWAVRHYVKGGCLVAPVSQYQKRLGERKKAMIAQLESSPSTAKDVDRTAKYYDHLIESKNWFSAEH